MPDIQIPLVKGQTRSLKNADYVDLLPVNILAVLGEAEGSQGYYRCWPGIVKQSDTDGVSRGSHWNTVKDAVYRVMGSKLYLGQSVISNVTVPSSGRVSMAHSRTSQAVAVGGKLKLYGYDGVEKELSNWPPTEEFPGETKTIQTTQHNKDGDTLKIITSTEQGKLTLTVTPTNGNNKTGQPLSIAESQWDTGVSQTQPAAGIPYITDLRVAGVKFAGATLTVTYTFNPNGVVPETPTDAEKKDISKLVWVQVTETTSVPNPQYDWGEVGDVCRIRGRYVFSQQGTDSFWITSLEDESKPDITAPAYRAENMPDGILAMREFRDFILAFGSSTIEFFRLTGDANNLVQFASSYMVPIGIAGQWALTDFGESFAFITNPSRGQVSIALMGQGTYSVISDKHVNRVLSEHTVGELSNAVLESFKTEDNEFLLVHLPEVTLVYSSAGKVWGQLKTGLDDGIHRAIDYRNEGSKITCGDKVAGLSGELSFSTTEQYGEEQEILLYSPILQLEGNVLFDLRLTALTGASSTVRHIMVSATMDGVTYGAERQIEYDGPWQWLRRSIMRKIGHVAMKIGFKFRVVGPTPCTLSDIKVRVE